MIFGTALGDEQQAVPENQTGCHLILFMRPD